MLFLEDGKREGREENDKQWDRTEPTPASPSPHHPAPKPEGRAHSRGPPYLLINDRALL